MSSYSAVVPVSWSYLTEILVPAWIDVLGGRRTLSSFAEQFARTPVTGVPHDWRYPWIPEDWAIPDGYVAEVGWTSNQPFLAADRQRASAIHRELERRGFAAAGTGALCRAIHVSAAAELEGADAFDDGDFYSYYGRMHHSPEVQVAGAKNRFFFLESQFVATWRSEHGAYDVVAQPSLDPALRALVEALFLSTRCFPATRVTYRNSTWPGYNDNRLQGLLAPAEVRQLAARLDELGQGDGEAHNLFPLFADRVRRSADQGLALVTLYDQL
jgi:hypothetical protein